MKFIVKLLTQRSEELYLSRLLNMTTVTSECKRWLASIECTSSLVVMLMLIYDSYIKKYVDL